MTVGVTPPAAEAAATRRPRVLVVGPLPPPFGGGELTNAMLVGSSLARHFEIHTLNTSKKRLRWAVESPSWRSVPDMLRHLAQLLGLLFRLRPEVVYVHAAGSLTFVRDWVMMAAARLCGRRVVCHYHGTLHTSFPSGETRFGRLAGRLMMAAAHRIIVVGPGYRERFGRIWGRSDIAWCPNMADVAFYRSVPADARAPWLLPGERGVLFVGRLTTPKGIWDLFEAMPLVLARHPEARFVLCGVAENEAREPVLRAEVQRRGVAPRVTFLGAVTGRDKALAYATAAVLALPSHTEAFPLVIPEAMAAGLPVVVTAVGAIPDYVRDGEDGFLVSPKDPAMLADRICRLLEDETLRGRMSERVRARAAPEFDIEVGASHVRDVLNELLAR